MAQSPTERVSRGLAWLGIALLIAGALVVVAGIALTQTIGALVTAASVAAFALALPGAASLGIAFWLEHLAERAERKAISAMQPGAEVPGISEPVRRYAIAIVAVLCAWGLRAGLDPWMPDEAPFITFYLAVAVAGWVGGFGPATAATVLSAAIAGFLYVRPEAGVDLGRFVLLAIFLLVCLGIAAIVSALHDALLRAHELARGVSRAGDFSRDPAHPLRTLVQQVPAALFMTDATQGCTWCNRAWLAFRGRSLTQELGDGWSEGVHPEDLARRRDAFAAAMAGREPRAVSYRLKHADGGYRQVRDIVVANVGPDGDVVGLLGASFEVDSPH